MILHPGRVKTLHPGVHGGILAKRDEQQHMAAIDEHKISPIDVVVVNLYPFRQTVTAEQSPSYETAVENIDIGELDGLLPAWQGFCLTSSLFPSLCLSCS